MNRDKDWDGRPLYYDRHGQPMTMHQWAEKFEDENYTHIARDVIGPDEPLDPAPLITVSTFWRGVNHNWRHDEPLIYETLIIGGGYDATGMRYATEKQAREGHRRVVEELRAGRGPVLRAVRDVGSSEGLFVAPEGAACFAALKSLRATGRIDNGERVVIFNTGSGIKYLDYFE